MKKQAAMIAICAALLMCVAAAGCTSTTSSSPNASATANSSSQAATAAATATPTPTATPLPSGGATSLTVLFFYDPTCPHCQAIEGQVQQIPTDGGKVNVQWVDSVTSPLTDQYGVTTVPTFVFLNGGSEVGTPVVAPTSTAPVIAQINSLLG